MTGSVSTLLRLMAQDVEDVHVMSAYLQDAVTVAADIAWLPHRHRFAVMFNRYRWECQCDDPADIAGNHASDMTGGMTGDMKCERIRTGLHFDSVMKVEHQNILPGLDKAPLELLAIDAMAGKADSPAVITLVFAGGGAIRLHTECVDAYMADVSEPWPARCKPEHEITDGD